MSSHSFIKLSLYSVCEVALSQKTDPFIPLWVHPTRLEKQVSIHLSQQPLHTTHITVLKPSTWQLINNWLTCFSGELNDSTLAALSAWSPAETETKETNSIMKPQTAITPLYFTIRDSNTPDSLWSQHYFFHKQPLLHISAVTTQHVKPVMQQENKMRSNKTFPSDREAQSEAFHGFFTHTGRIKAFLLCVKNETSRVLLHASLHQSGLWNCVTEGWPEEIIHTNTATASSRPVGFKIKLFHNKMQHTIYRSQEDNEDNESKKQFLLPFTLILKKAIVTWILKCFSF